MQHAWLKRSLGNGSEEAYRDEVLAQIFGNQRDKWIERKIDLIRSVLENTQGDIQNLHKSLACTQLWLEYFHAYSDRFLA